MQLLAEQTWLPSCITPAIVLDMAQQRAPHVHRRHRVAYELRLLCALHAAGKASGQQLQNLAFAWGVCLWGATGSMLPRTCHSWLIKPLHNTPRSSSLPSAPARCKHRLSNHTGLQLTFTLPPCPWPQARDNFAAIAVWSRLLQWCRSRRAARQKPWGTR